MEAQQASRGRVTGSNSLLPNLNIFIVSTYVTIFSQGLSYKEIVP
jgi:hypothetical protein